MFIIDPRPPSRLSFKPLHIHSVTAKSPSTACTVSFHLEIPGSSPLPTFTSVTKCPKLVRGILVLTGDVGMTEENTKLFSLFTHSLQPELRLGDTYRRFKGGRDAYTTIGRVETVPYRFNGQHPLTNHVVLLRVLTNSLWPGGRSSPTVTQTKTGGICFSLTEPLEGGRLQFMWSCRHAQPMKL